VWRVRAKDEGWKARGRRGSGSRTTVEWGVMRARCWLLAVWVGPQKEGMGKRGVGRSRVGMGSSMFREGSRRRSNRLLEPMGQDRRALSPSQSRSRLLPLPISSSPPLHLHLSPLPLPSLPPPSPRRPNLPPLLQLQPLQLNPPCPSPSPATLVLPPLSPPRRYATARRLTRLRQRRILPRATDRRRELWQVWRRRLKRR
jgi:hypothetical protein